MRKKAPNQEQPRSNAHLIQESRERNIHIKEADLRLKYCNDFEKK